MTGHHNKSNKKSAFTTQDHAQENWGQIPVLLNYI